MKSSNDYARSFGALYPLIPKSVFAAVAISYACRHAEIPPGEELPTQSCIEQFLKEWRILFENGIIPQTPIPPSVAADFLPNAGKAESK